MTSHPMERGFLTLPGRQVHYRRAGSGPPVVLLHQSPKSSEELIPLIALLAPHFTVLAPDTPGYGLSDPIAAPDSEPEIDAFVDAVSEFFDAMGLEHPGLYGLHTGAAIATRFAARYPERVAALVANGTLIKTPEERTDMLAHYLPPFVPSWDGAHLAWAWARMREQLIFFPWHKRDPSARIAYPITLEGLQTNTLALLQAGDNYRTAYRTAFAYAAEEDLPRIQVPARFVCAEPDPLFRCLDRFPPLPENAAIARVRDARAALDYTRDFLLEVAGTGATPKAVPTTPSPRRMSSRLIRTGTDQMHVRLNVDASGRPVVVLHESGASARALTEFLGGFIGRRPIYAPDLPGHGDSDPPQGSDGIIEEMASRLSEMSVALGLASADIIAIGGSAAIAVEWAKSNPGQIASVTICNLSLVPESRIAEFDHHQAPSLTPDWAGGHLLRAWQSARDQDLFWPWFDTSADAILAAAVPASDQLVQQRVIDLFKSEATHPRLARALIRAPILDRLRNYRGPLHLFASIERNIDRSLGAIAPVARLPACRLNWAPVILDAVDRR